MALFALQIVFTGDNERRVQTRPIHRQYLTKLFEEGKLHESGPLLDDSGAIIIYIAEDQDEAESLLANDPYSLTGGIIETATIHEWNRVFPPTS